MQPITIEALQALVGKARGVFGTNAVVIAGGAVRDTLHGRPVKDIDMFVTLADVTDGDPEEVGAWFKQACASLANLMHVGGSQTFRQTPAEYGPLTDFCEIPATAYGVPLQIILIDDDPADDVHKYDFDLSQCFVTPNALFFTEAYRRSTEVREITYTPSAEDLAAQLRSKARLSRLRAKYPDWIFRNCEALDALPEPEPTDLTDLA
ncbi:hypothetical protein [Burkholderia gladioli]|uniref:hypothetical protein n=1 Tax=Burkholderia gladioli TaxID=28095 RepID=UPI0016411166|nr:hypothetical protein [Burkholderia gladioli]